MTCRRCIFARPHGPEVVICFNAKALAPEHAQAIDQRFFAANDHRCKYFAPKVVRVAQEGA